MVRFDVRKVSFLLLLLLAVPAAEAQLWSGPAAVEVRVEGQKGLPVAGARVQLRSTAVQPEDGPPSVMTDSRGRAVVSGLAEGPWKLEVSQEGYMTYLAEITVFEKNRPKVGLATQVNVPGALRTLRVDLARGRSEPQAARAPREQPAPVPAAPAPAPRREIPPPPRPEPVAPPAPAQTEPRPAPAPPRETPALSPTPTAPAVPAPAPEPAPRPVPTPAPPPPATPAADSVRMRSFEDRTCVECQPGESSLSTERVIPPGGGTGCGDVAAQLQGGDVPPGLPAGCHVLRIAVPAGARYLGYRFEVQDGSTSLDCLAGQDCPQSTGRWPGNPVLIRGAGGTVVLAPFEAGPADRERRAVLTVYFTAGKRR